MIVFKFIRVLGLATLGLSAACTFPGQYFGANPDDSAKQVSAADGIDYRLTPIDAISLNAIASRSAESVVVPLGLKKSLRFTNTQWVWAMLCGLPCGTTRN